MIQQSLFLTYGTAAARQIALKNVQWLNFFIMHSRYIVIGFISWIGTTLFLKSQLNHRTYSCAKNYLKSILWSFLIGKSYLAWRMSHIIQPDSQKEKIMCKIFFKKYSERMVKRYLKKMHSHIQAEYKMVFHMYRSRCKFSKNSHPFLYYVYP